MRQNSINLQIGDEHFKVVYTYEELASEPEIGFYGGVTAELKHIYYYDFDNATQDITSLIMNLCEELHDELLALVYESHETP